MYDIDEGIKKELPTSTGLQLPEGLNSSNSNIPNSNENVKLPSTNIIQENINNTQELNNKKFFKRVIHE